MLINTATDLQTAEPSAERTAFLQSLLDDYTTFDDAEYPEKYDRKQQPEDNGYIEPVIRQVWNAGAAALWGFDSREAIEAALQAQSPAEPVEWNPPANPTRYTQYEAPDGTIWVWDQPRNELGQYMQDNPDTEEVESALQWIPVPQQ